MTGFISLGQDHVQDLTHDRRKCSKQQREYFKLAHKHASKFDHKHASKYVSKYVSCGRC